jgi:arylsulfatase
MKASIGSPAAPTNHTTQYFEMAGCRGIYHDGWKAVTHHGRETDQSYPDSEWELYHLDEDFSECHDLAGQQPDKLREMIELFDAEATRYGVYPLDDRLTGLFSPSPRKRTPRARTSFVYLPPIDHLITDVTPPLGARSWDMRFDLSRFSMTDHGALLALGTPNAGHVAYIIDNRLVYDVNFFGEHQIVRSAEIPSGRHVFGFHLERVRRGPGHLRYTVDGDAIGGGGTIDKLAVMISSTGLDLGRNPSSISPDFEGPFDFTGELHRVEIDVRRALDATSAHDEVVIAGRAEAGRD